MSLGQESFVEEDARNKRRYERCLCHVKITYTILSANDATPFEYGVTSSRDLSEGGVCIETDRPVPVPILMQLNLSIPVRPFHLLVLGKAVRCIPSEGGLHEVGVKFVGILPSNFRQILDVADLSPSPPPAQNQTNPPVV